MLDAEPLAVDPEREGMGEDHPSGIYVDALREGTLQKVDIYELDQPSLIRWLRPWGK